MRGCSLCAGLGGFDLAAEWVGWETVVMVEWDIKRQKWLSELYPNAFIHGNIDDFEAERWAGSVDIIFGGEPCQGNSVAGDRLGFTDPRFKWPQYLRAVKAISPLWVVNENVSGSISNGVLDQKISDLEAIGYACWPPLVIPAGAVGADHRRDRVWLVAYSLRAGRQQLNSAALPAGQTKGNVRNHPKRPFEYRPVSGYRNSSEILREADGLSAGIPAGFRNKAIESFGNAIVPQVAYEIFKTIQQIESCPTPPSC